MKKLEVRFPGKRVLITGATTGLGEALAYALAERGWKVAVTGRKLEAVKPEEERFTGLAAKLLVTPPENCAADILKSVHRGRKRIITGFRSTTMYWMSRVLPNSYPCLLKLLAR